MWLHSLKGFITHMKQPYFKNNAAQKYAIGLMSGTSTDGIDAALVQISGCGVSTKVELKSFDTYPFTKEARERILNVATGNFGGSEEVCKLSFYLGELFATACESICEKANIKKSDIAFIGSHGQTIFHAPKKEAYLDSAFKSTLQIGEADIIAERMGCPVVSDFRTRDMAAGGQGAPLVPYTEYLLYRDEHKTVALQNIGGIGNVTLLAKSCELKDVFAFDTGPGNMIMDAVVCKITNGNMRYDKNGAIAAAAKINNELLNYMLQDDYLQKAPPKTTGREYYGEEYVSRLLQRASELNVCLEDVLATATRFTAESIKLGVELFCKPTPELLIVGGGGSMNPVLMCHLKQCLSPCRVVTNEELGLNSNAKEAIAFAVLANETLHGIESNAPGATGARKNVVLGKISL